MRNGFEISAPNGSTWLFSSLGTNKKKNKIYRSAPTYPHNNYISSIIVVFSVRRSVATIQLSDVRVVIFVSCSSFVRLHPSCDRSLPTIVIHYCVCTAYSVPPTQYHIYIYERRIARRRTCTDDNVIRSRTSARFMKQTDKKQQQNENNNKTPRLRQYRRVPWHSTTSAIGIPKTIRICRCRGGSRALARSRRFVIFCMRGTAVSRAGPLPYCRPRHRHNRNIRINI